MDFLGFRIRRFPNGKLLTKPSNEAMRRIRKRLSSQMRALRGSNADAMIPTMNADHPGVGRRLLPDRARRMCITRPADAETGFPAARSALQSREISGIVAARSLGLVPRSGLAVAVPVGQHGHRVRAAAAWPAGMLFWPPCGDQPARERRPLRIPITARE